MARGHRRWSMRRKELSKNAAAAPATGRRSLAAGALALGGVAASLLTPAQAVTLGDASLQSALGQPLSARIPVQLAPGEMLGAACVSIPTPARSDLSALPQPQVTVPETPGTGSLSLHVTTTQPLYEPMYELQVQVRCPGTPLLVRQYVLMLDLPGTVLAGAAAATAEPQPVPAAAATTGIAADQAATPAPRGTLAVRPRPQAAAGTPIPSGSRYRVAAGDTLSTIAARVGGGHGVWRLADRIFAANPQAFIGGNPDLIKLGSEIIIPAPVTDASPPATATTAAAATPSPAMAQAPDASPPAIEAVGAAPAAEATPAPEAAPAPVTSPVPAAPGSADAASPVFADEQPVARDPQAEARPTAVPPAPVERDGAPAWLAALIGVLIGAAVSLALLRDRLTGALASLLRPRQPVIEPLARAPLPAAPEVQAAPQFRQPMQAPEPSMVVEEHHHAEGEHDPLVRTDESVTVEQPAQLAATAELPAVDAGHDLASLFDEVPDLPLYEPAGDALPSAEDLDLDLSAASIDATVDQDIGWLGDETSLTTTPQPVIDPAAGGADTVEEIDLQTLSQRAGDDTAISQTLRDALNLLESDYEEELTASQVVDRKQLTHLLDEGDGEDTMVRTGTDQLPRRR